MAERLFSAMKWLCYLFVVHSVPGWRAVSGVTVPVVPAPSGIEAQAKFFQDFFSVQLSPYKIEFGHVCEDPHTWEQRYEKKDFKNHRDMGKVRWGDKNGGYGEHYWDLNHAGNTGSHGSDDYHDDDGSYHEDPSDAYNDHSEDSHNYEPESYSSDEIPQYEENGRAKRAHSRSKVTTEKGESDDDDDYEEPPRRKQRKNRKNKYHRERHEEIYEDEDSEEEDTTTKSPKIKNDRDDEEVTVRPKKNVDKTKTKQSNDRHPEQIKNVKKQDQSSETREVDPRGRDPQKPQGREKNHYVLVVNQKERQEDKPTEEKTEPNRFVNYEGGSGVRQHYSSEAAPSASAPRLFIEAQTGHIVDRMTGQTYVLQPLVHSNKYN